MNIMTDKIKILFLGASPTDVDPLRLSEEVRQIESEIQAGPRRDSFDLESQWAVRPADLRRALLRFQPHIVHFSGHGSPNAEIILEGDDGKSRPVNKQALIGLFKVLKDNVRIVVLNSCYSQPQAEALSEVIDHTVGTSRAVKDKSAVAFAAAFYSALAFGRSVQDAFDVARAEIDLEGLSGSDIPVLLVREGVNSAEPFLKQPPPVEPRSDSSRGSQSVNITHQFGGVTINAPVNVSGDLLGGNKFSDLDQQRAAMLPEDRLTALTKIFDRLIAGAASDEDRRLFRRAIFEGKAMLTPSEGESSGQDTASKITRHGDRLHIELGAELYRELQEQLHPPPRGLPPPLPGSIFLGRENDLSDVKQRLGVNVAPPIAGELTVVRGWPGVGKTTFVSVICRDPDITRSFPDGVLWTYLDQEPELFSKLAAWGRAITGTDELLRIPTLSEAAARLAELLRRRRMLLVVDDIWKAEHAIPFLQASGNSQCAMLLTTRLPEVAEDLAGDLRRIYTLPVLTEESSLLLLRNLIPAIVEQYEALCRQLAHDLEYLPLSLHIAGSALRRDAKMGFDVVKSISEIREGAIIKESVPLNVAVTGSRPSLKALLERSVSRLDEHARECFAFLGAFAPKPATFDLAAMQSVWQVSDAKPIVRKLVGLGLLEPVGGRFQMHALLVDYARSLLTD
jgi:hypothetical protein